MRANLSIRRPCVALLALAALLAPGAHSPAAEGDSTAPATAAPLPPPDPVRLAKAKTLTDVLKLDAQVRSEAAAGFDASLENARSQVVRMPEKVQGAFTGALDEVRQLVMKKIDWQAIDDEVTAAYARAYSADELDQLTTFYRSAIGQRVISASPGLSAVLTSTSAERINRLMPEIQALVEQRMHQAMENVQSQERADVGIIPGKAFPTIIGTTIDGKAFDLAAWKGRVVLVYFWATVCPPCVEAAPGLVATYGKYHDQGFEVIGISLDQDRSDVTGFVASRKIPWTQICDGRAWDTPSAVSHAVHNLPSEFLLGRDGNLIDCNLGGKELDAAIGKALAARN